MPLRECLECDGRGWVHFASAPEVLGAETCGACRGAGVVDDGDDDVELERQADEDRADADRDEGR